jgi:peptidyl-Lys metalloendopeptidase
VTEGFGCRLASADEHVSGEPVLVDMELRNLADAPRYVLKWYTPFEGIAGEIFRVEHDGETVPYRGILAKRGEPVASDYIEIAAGASAEASVDLAPSYDLTAPGTYRVEFVAGLHDVAEAAETVPRPRAQHRQQRLDCGTVRFRVLARPT